jgi:membrane associated rhomboid family serine protease
MSFGPPVMPPVVKQLLIINAVAYVAQQLLARSDFTVLFAVTPALVWQGGYLWQPFTYMWLHGSLIHVGMNCFVLWMFGSQMAMAWGSKRFLRFYLICGVGAGFIISLWPYLAVILGIAPQETLIIPTLGASGAIYGVMLAYSLTWPDRTIMLIFPPVAFRAIWLIPILFVFTMMGGGNNISHIGHLGGVLVAWLYLRRDGTTGRSLNWGSIKHRWRRYRMRQKLRAVQTEDLEARRRERRDRNDRTLH